jgi:hypothetical protein
MGRAGERQRQAKSPAKGSVDVLGLAFRLMERTKARHIAHMAVADQKLVDAQEALARLEVDEAIHVRALRRKIDEIDRLERELATALRERDEARSLLEQAYLVGRRQS